MYSLTQAATYPLPNSNSNQQQQAYVLSIARTPASRLAAISSDQALTLLDPATLRAVGAFATEHGNLTALGVFGGNGNGGSSGGLGEVVCTAGENGSVAIWDLRAGRKVSQFQGEFSFFLFPQEVNEGLGEEQRFISTPLTKPTSRRRS